MESVEMSNIDLECGRGGRSSAVSDGGSSDDGSVCYFDADGCSYYSQLCSTHGGSFDDYGSACASDTEIDAVSDSRRASSAAESDCSICIENGDNQIRVQLAKVERDCRICHLSLESGCWEFGIAIELGCSCKDDLAAVHKECAEAWFKIKGNKTCEICNSVARNVFVTDETETSQHTNENNVTATAAVVSAAVPSATESQSRLNGHRFLNFLLACIVFAFVLSWLFHFNIP